MSPGPYRFGEFAFDPDNRQLRRDGVRVELNARYFDALSLLVREPGRLITKDRFLDEVWRGVPVTDEALTQCIKTLRRLLGDDVARPRFIETVPKHGYRFIAPVDERADEKASGTEAQATAASGDRWRELLLLGGAGTVGAGIAGVLGGLFYGFVSASQPAGPEMGATSILLVVLWLTIAAALMGGAGVSFGIAASGFARAGQWRVLGGALGGLTVGGMVKMLGLDAFTLLLGQSPGDVTGAAEGAALGAAVGLGSWLASRDPQPRSLRQGVALAALTGGTAGVLIATLGGRLMGGSLDLLARQLPNSRLRFDPLDGLLGEQGFGPAGQILTGGMEGALFGACIVGAMMLARRSQTRS